jgi:hypothetical protein
MSRVSSLLRERLTSVFKEVDMSKHLQAGRFAAFTLIDAMTKKYRKGPFH